MSEVNNKAESKVEVKRIRSRNTYDSINQIIETYNSSNGWALKKVNMLGMNIDVVVERSVDQTRSLDQATQVEKANTDKVVSNEKTKETVTESSTTSEKSDEVAVVVDEEDKPKARTTRSRTTKK